MGKIIQLINPIYLTSASGAGSPGDAAQNFDGADDRFDATGWYPSDSDKGIISIWFRRDTTGNIETLHALSISHVRIRIIAGGQVQIFLRTFLNITLLDINSGSTFITDTNWHHILASWNLVATPVSWFYLDDVDVEIVTLKITGTVDWTTSTNRIGANSDTTPGEFFNGCMSEFYIQIGEFLDLDTVANRRRFIDAAGNAVDLGVDGSTPTGTQPEVYIPGDDFTDNKGANANLVASGSPVTCSNSPD